MSEPAETTQTIQGPGQRLQLAREAMGFSIGQVATELRLSQTVIEQIEKDDYQLGRSLIFVRGYLRSYATLLNLPASAILAAFDDLKLQQADSGKARVPLIRRVQKTAFSLRTAVYIGIALIVVMLALGWQLFRANTQVSMDTYVDPLSLVDEQVVIMPAVAQENELDNLAIASEALTNPFDFEGELLPF